MTNDATTPGVPLPGSSRAPLPGATRATPLDSSESISVTVVLRRKAELPAALATGQETVSPAELAASYGASPADVDLVRQAAADAGVEVTAVDEGSRRVVLSGPAAALAAMFGTSLVSAETPDPATGRPVAHRHRSGELTLPASLDGVVIAVLGLDNRPQARAQFRIARAEALSVSYTPLQLATIYAFPDGTTGAGQTLAIIELGGGFGQADLDTYFSGLGITGPIVTAVGVDGATNLPGGDPQGADGEVLLDIEVAGGLAPGAAIVVYFAPNTDQGFLDAVSTAALATPTPTAMSISWGQSEDQWTAQARTAMDAAFADAAALGVTVTAAAGDDGSADGSTDGTPHVDFPAASPHVLACGGTRLAASGVTGQVTSETVWNEGAGRGATGGGISDTFGRPDWQGSAGTPDGGRGVPDVAADADPQTGYQVLVDGTPTVIGGTSAVAPLWAALVCRLAEGAGRRFGLLTPLLYAGVSAGTTPLGFRDVTSGNNGAFSAGPGWDACTGLGVPVGTALLSRLTQSPAGP
ncbi:MAG: kumamolisin [Frankiales bacterium]|jgi:kumamolisin|nr:kumamolisin [Frankiales bacterium]